MSTDDTEVEEGADGEGKFKRTKKSAEPSDRAKAQPEPTPAREDLFLWLETLFYEVPETSHFPDKIEVNVVKGKEFEIIGTQIKLYEFGPRNEMKPSRSRLVAISNEIVHSTQRDCDVQRKSVVYAAFAWSFHKKDQPYEAFRIRCQPRPDHKYDGEPREEEEEVSFEKRFSGQVLGHGERMFNLYGASMEGMLDRLDRDKQRDAAEIERLRKECDSLRSQLERALSLELEREEKRTWIKLKNDVASRGLTMAETYAPLILGKVFGDKNSLPAHETLETITLKKFITGLTPEQSNAVFGTDDGTPERNLVKPGVLALPQGQVLWEIAFGKRPLEAIEALFPGGPLEITPKQLQALATQCGLDVEAQLLPLKLMFDSLMKQRQK